MAPWPVAMTLLPQFADTVAIVSPATWWVLGIFLGAWGAALAAVIWRAWRWSHPLAFSCAASFNAFVCKVWYRHRRIGPCTIPAQGPVIVTANHTSPTDPSIICAACPYRRISFLIAREYANLKVFGYIVRLLDCIPVRRDGRDIAATKAGLRHLRAGKVLAIFIEGRIPAPNEQVTPKDGAALLALRTGTPVIPCHIRGTVYRERVLAGFFARHRARIRFGPAVDLSDLAGRTDRQAVSQATQRIFECIRELAPTPNAAQPVTAEAT